MKFQELRVEMMNAYSSSMEAYSDKNYEKAFQDMLEASKIAKQLSDITPFIEDAKEYLNLSKHYYSKAISYHDLCQDQTKKPISLMDMPTQGFSDFIGLEKEKKYLEETIILPWKRNEFYIRNKNALMIYGPHGVSKTRFAHSLIKELHAKSYFIQPLRHFAMTDFPDVEHGFNQFFSKIEKENNVVIFMESPIPYFSNGQDEFSKDACELFFRIFKKECKRIKKKKLNILFVATTSAPDKMSKTVFSDDLFDDFIEIPLPSFEIRKELFKRYLKDFKVDEGMIGYLAEKTDGFVTTDISRIAKNLIESQSFEKESIDDFLNSFKKEDSSEYRKNIDSFKEIIRSL